MSPIPLYPTDSPYRRLAARLDALADRFPPAPDQSDLHLLAGFFSPQEADLAADLLPEAETPADIAARTGRDAREIMGLLKEMSRKGLIHFGKTSQGRPGFALMAFIVGFYEAQEQHLTAEQARLVENYFHSAFMKTLALQPQVHRVIPIEASLNTAMEVRPYESVEGLLDQAKAWGVLNCICRVQKTLLGAPCGHPVDVCLAFANQENAFEGAEGIRALTREEARQTLKRAAEAGLVHCVSNIQQEVGYICNCCTCSCGILRGMVEMGVANVVAHSPFVNQVDEELCAGCGQCVDACPFGALTLDGTAQLIEIRCAGCGVCVGVCPQGALSLRRRAEEALPPQDRAAWRAARLSA